MNAFLVTQLADTVIFNIFCISIYVQILLFQYKEEKHQLFNTLKKVLYEDETRRRSREVNFESWILEKYVLYLLTFRSNWPFKVYQKITWQA